MKQCLARLAALALPVAVLVACVADASSACTRTLYTGADNTVITGRNMDWDEDMGSNLWAFPAGLKRDGAAGPNSIQWTSKYGSVITSSYEVGSLAESDYGKPDGSRPLLSIAAWWQYALDNYATVAEAVEALAKEPF